ncbi:hypothetical protein NQ315_000251 [Exocentrus adspersus]|uniref:Bacterial surface antigen (D15) domain-containing protein n=1 Tax=Exocentrus adspersus TaxID=1586481 RepID=A0AAV8VQ83_9CUCU|nr:hypothetical protein NQ315_000251 [Exocentrus adspersus]
MGTVHAKAEQSLTEAPDFGSKNLPRDHAEPHTFKEIDLEAVRARVDRINVDGLARTKNDIVEDCIKELFKAKDFQDVLIKAHRARVKLDELGCFKNISVFIDTSKGDKATPDGLEVTFNVKEFTRLTGGVSTQVGNNEGALLIGMRAPNIFGRGERVQVEYSHGSKRTSNFNLSFIKPFRGSHRPTFTTSVFQSQSEWPSSGYKQLERGLLLDLGFYSTPFLKHNLQWEANIRDLSALSRTTSFEVREQSGLSLKSALKHILSFDLRDDLIFPSAGSLFQVTTEVAGIGGNVGFLKNDFFLQGNYALIEDVVIQGCLSAGLRWRTGTFLGGPLSVRGFEQRGIGPHSDGDALGATAHWSAGLHLFTPLPFRPGRGGFGELFRTHFFVNAGNVGNFRMSKDSDLIETLKANMRLSYGLGVALRLGNMARLEVNYCFPYSFDKGDQTHAGVQFGIGVQFL